MYIGTSQSLLRCLLLQPALDFFSQLLALLCVPLSKNAHNAWYTHTQMTSSRCTGATQRETNVTFLVALANSQILPILVDIGALSFSQSAKRLMQSEFS